MVTGSAGRGLHFAAAVAAVMLAPILLCASVCFLAIGAVAALRLGREPWAAPGWRLLALGQMAMAAGIALELSGFMEALMDPLSSSVLVATSGLLAATVVRAVADIRALRGDRDRLHISQKQSARSEKRLHAVFEHAPFGYYLHDLDGVAVDANRTMRELLGYSRDEFIGRNIADLDILEPADVARAENDRATRSARGEGTGPDEYVVRCRNGRHRTVEINTHPVELDGRTLVIGIARDVTARRATEDRLTRYRERLSAMASEMALAEERERRRVATDLHDRTVQNLALTRVKLGALREGLGSETAERDTDAICKLVERTIADTRALVFELSPPVLYELGFEPAVEWLAERAHDSHGIPCHVDTDHAPKPLDDELAIVLFQSVRELLGNVGKHARATNARIRVARANGDIRISLEDDGIGFEPAGAAAVLDIGPAQGGFGLFNIRERLSHLGGSLEIESAPGRGTRVTLTAPLDRTAAS